MRIRAFPRAARHYGRPACAIPLYPSRRVAAGRRVPVSRCRGGIRCSLRPSPLVTSPHFHSLPPAPPDPPLATARPTPTADPSFPTRRVASRPAPPAPPPPPLPDVIPHRSRPPRPAPAPHPPLYRLLTMPHTHPPPPLRSWTKQHALHLPALRDVFGRAGLAYPGAVYRARHSFHTPDASPTANRAAPSRPVPPRPISSSRLSYRILPTPAAPPLVSPVPHLARPPTELTLAGIPPIADANPRLPAPHTDPHTTLCAQADEAGRPFFPVPGVDPAEGPCLPKKSASATWTTAYRSLIASYRYRKARCVRTSSKRR